MPVFANGNCELFCRNRKADGHQVDVLIHCSQLCFEFPVDSLVVVALDRRFVAHFQFIFFEIFADVCLDRVTDAVLKIGKGIATLLRDLQMGAVDQCFGSDQPGLRQLIDNLLQCQIAGIFFFQNEIADLRHCKWKGYLVEQIKNDQFIECKRFLVHNYPLV